MTRLKKTLRFVAAAVALSVVALGASRISTGQAQSNSPDQANRFGGTYLPYEQVVKDVSDESALVVRTSGEPVSAANLGWRLQLERAKDFFVNPERFTSNRVLYLYDLSELSAEEVTKVLEQARKPDAVSYFLVGDAPAGSSATPQQYFGTSFKPYVLTDSGPSSLDFEMKADLIGALAEVGQTGIELAAPKASKNFGRFRQIYVGLDAPVPGIKAQHYALSSGTILSAGNQ